MHANDACTKDAATWDIGHEDGDARERTQKSRGRGGIRTADLRPCFYNGRSCSRPTKCRHTQRPGLG